MSFGVRHQSACATHQSAASCSVSKFERKFLTLPWQTVRPSVDVKLLAKDNELYVLARSHARTLKERAMRRRRLKKLWRRLHELQQQTLTRDALLLKLGGAKKEAGRAYSLVDIQIPDPKQPITPETFTFSLRRDKLRTVRRREGRDTTSVSPRSSRHSKS